MISSLILQVNTLRIINAEMDIIQIHNSYGYTISSSMVISAMICDKTNYPGGLHLNLHLSVLLASLFVSLHNCNSLIVVPFLLNLSFTQLGQQGIFNNESTMSLC